MKPLTFLEPSSLTDAVAAAAEDGVRPIAGGSDLLGQLKDGSESYEHLVSLAALDELRGIERTADGLRIGALTTITELEYSDLLDGPYRMLAEAARSVATPEIRNQGTLGGNLCQRPRCLHYRSALVDCLKKGGSGCPAIETPYQGYLSVFGGSGCYAVHASDLAPPLIALGATVALQGPNGSREMPVDEFFAGPDVDPSRENVLLPGEILTHVTLPQLPSSWRGAYFKARERTAGDFPIVSLALGFEVRDGRIAESRVVLGGVAPTPRRSTDAEARLDGQAPSGEAGASAADAALAGAQPLEHNGFKLDLARALIVRGVTRVAG